MLRKTLEVAIQRVTVGKSGLVPEDETIVLTVQFFLGQFKAVRTYRFFFGRDSIHNFFQGVVINGRRSLLGTPASF